MGTFKIRKLRRNLKGRFSKIDSIVETGTFRGRATRVMSAHFNQVITIELDKKLHEGTKAEMKNEGYENVRFIHGDSGAVIQDLVKQLEVPTIFFLDAHWSGDQSVNWDESKWKGYGVNTAHGGTGDQPSAAEQVPLDKEISAIAYHYPHAGVIYIDDMDKFGRDGKGLKNASFQGEDYSHIDLNVFKDMFGVRLCNWINLGGQLIITFFNQPVNAEEEKKMALHRKYIYPLNYFWNELTIRPYLFIRKTFNI